MGTIRTPDTAYINGRVYTVDEAFSVASAFCVSDGRFLAVGSNEEILSLCGEKTEVIDLRHRTVLPGLIDSHLHLHQTGEKLLTLDLTNLSKEEILNLVAKTYTTTKPGEWILGVGWFNDHWKIPAFPTKEELDQVAPDTPVYLKRACMHASWANSEAFRKAGITDDTSNPIGGEYLRKEDGTLLGIVTDQGQAPFDRIIPPYTKHQLQKAALLFQEKLFEAGLTSVHDLATLTEDLDAWEPLYQENALKLRIYACMRFFIRPEYDALADASKEFFKRGIQIGKYDNRLTVRSFKVSCDGSLGARSAWMLNDYEDQKGHCGNGKFTDEQLYALLREAYCHGFQIVCHAIGDAANRQCLNVYERILKELPHPDHRSRIEHAQVLSPSDIPRFHRLGIIPTAQTIFVHSDKAVAVDRLGEERIKGAYAWQTLLRSGNYLPNGSDAPSEPFNPFLGIYCAVTRKDEYGEPKDGWYPGEAMTREQAIRSFTTWGAYAAFEEHLKASIECGKLADFILIDRDIMSCPAEELKDITVLETVIGGKTVYRR